MPYRRHLSCTKSRMPVGDRCDLDEVCVCPLGQLPQFKRLCFILSRHPGGWSCPHHPAGGHARRNTCSLPEISFKDKDLRACASGGIPLAGILHGSLPCLCPDGVYQVEQNDPNDGDDPQHYHRVEATCINGQMPNIGTANDANGCDADSYSGRQVMPITPLRTTIEYLGPPWIKPLLLLGLRW